MTGGDPMNDTELRELARLLATPIDFDALEAAGVMERKGAWWRIHDPEALPEHVMRHARAMKQTSDGSVLVRFGKPSRAAANLYERLSEED